LRLYVQEGVGFIEQLEFDLEQTTRLAFNPRRLIAQASRQIDRQLDRLRRLTGRHGNVFAGDRQSDRGGATALVGDSDMYPGCQGYPGHRGVEDNPKLSA